MIEERVWVKRGGEHAGHVVYEQKRNGVTRVVCDVCKVVLERWGPNP